jgi:hypothetical protein
MIHSSASQCILRHLNYHLNRGVATLDNLNTATFHCLVH